jgi:putative membrane protein
MMNGMDGMWAGMGAMMIASAVFSLALLTAVVLGIVWLAGALRHGPPRAHRSDAEQVLRRRYAAGEINDDEYHERLAGLHA